MSHCTGQFGQEQQDYTEDIGPAESLMSKIDVPQISYRAASAKDVNKHLFLIKQSNEAIPESEGRQLTVSMVSDIEEQKQCK